MSLYLGNTEIRGVATGDAAVSFNGINRETFYAHANSTNNPHNVTAAQIGAATTQYVNDYVNALIDALRPKSATAYMPSSNWVGSANLYSQIVVINGVTANSKIDLQPTAAQIMSLNNAGTAMVAENNNGTITIYAIGNKPNSDYTMQVLLTEVAPV